MASSVFLRKRRSFLKILLLAKHTRGFLTNLLLRRKYFLCSNCTGGETNIRQKKVRQRYFAPPQSHRQSTASKWDKCKWVGKKIKRKPLFSVLGSWVTCTSREHHRPNVRRTRRNSPQNFKTGRNSCQAQIAVKERWISSQHRFFFEELRNLPRPLPPNFWLIVRDVREGGGVGA